MCEKIRNDWQTERNKKKCLGILSFADSSNTSWITCKAKIIIHHARIFIIWTTSPYASESRSEYQKWQFAPDEIDIVFVSLVFFRATLEARWRWKVEVSVPSPPATEKTNGVKVLCSTFIILLLYNSFSYLARAWKEFFQKAYFSVSQN